MQSLSGTYYILYEAMDGKKGRVVEDEKGQVFRSEDAAKLHAVKQDWFKKYKIIPAEKYMQELQKTIANRNR